MIATVPANGSRLATTFRSVEGAGEHAEAEREAPEIGELEELAGFLIERNGPARDRGDGELPDEIPPA